jgi:uncharacterized protein (DUF2336 family)
MSDGAALGSQNYDASAMKAAGARLAATSFRNLMSRWQKAERVSEEPDPAIVAPVFEEKIELPPPVVEEEQPHPEAEPALTGSFEENFTYVPEPGEAIATTVSPEDEAEIHRREMAERALQLVLENIWRLLLAKPTVDDRAQYLQEAAEIHEGDPDFLPLPAEHDLSRILGVSATGEVVEDADDELSAVSLEDADELAKLLIGLMAAGSGSGQPQERALASDTLLRLLPRLQARTIEMIARRMTLMDNPPQFLVTQLLRDERPEIFTPLLEDCCNISDRDLLAVIGVGEPHCLRLIARRRRLTRGVCDALITSGDPSAVLTLVRNAEADISQDGFRALLVLCEHNQELLAPLATRPDIGAALAFELFWLSPPQLRRFILSRHLTDSETLHRILKITMAANREPHHVQEPMNQHALMDALDRATRGHIEIAADELAVLMRLSASTIMRILNDLSGEALVIMLKAAGYPRSAVTGLMTRLQEATLPVIARDRDITELQIMFETLSFNKARVLMTYWDWAQGKLGPYVILK